MSFLGAFGWISKIRKWGIGWIAVLAFGFAPPFAAGAEQSAAASNASAIDAFRSSAETLYDSLNQGNRLQALRAMNELDASFRKLPMTKIASAEGVQALAGSVSEMKRAMASAVPDAQRLEQAAGTLRLAADALANPGKPMWLQYRSILKEDADELGKALGSNADSVSSEARQAFRELQAHYGLIRTAAALQSEPYVLERADSVMRYAERILNADKPEPGLLNNLGANVRYAMDGLFPAGSQEPAAVAPVMPASWGFAATIGSFIVTILTWAGWRRYRYDRNHPPSGRAGPRQR